MSRSKGTVIENSFVGGLNTEATALTFPTNACTETNNCVFNETGRVTRRKEFDLEDDFTLNTLSVDAGNYAYTEYLWESAGGTGLINLMVVQDGSLLRFYNVSNTTTVSPNVLSTAVDLTTYAVTSSSYIPAETPCQYAQGNGTLVVVNKACEPILIQLDPITFEVSSSVIVVRYRDFLGVETSYADNTRPAFADIAAMKVDPSGALHFYNLLNQGWWQGGISSGSPDANSALGQWDTARTDMPSMQDYIGYFRSSPSDPFDNALVNVHTQGNSLAPKGHFILSLGEADRTQALVDQGYTLSYTSSAASLISYASGTVIGNMTNNSRAFDNSTATSTTDTGSDSGTWVGGTGTTTNNLGHTFNGYVGKNYGASPKKVNHVTVKNSASWDGSGTLTQSSSPATLSFGTATGTITFRLYGKNTTAPSSGTDGTLLGTSTRAISRTPATSGSLSTGYTLLDSSLLSVADTTITSSDTTTTYQYVWVYAVVTFDWDVSGVRAVGTWTLATTLSIPEIYVYENLTTTGSGIIPSTDITSERPAAVAFYAGRVWYGGIDYSYLSGNLYFSQIVDSTTKYGKCYQVNDPTAEDLNQVLPSDGGVVRIPEMGRVIKLWSQQSSLFIFATNGIWQITGSGQGVTFEATDYIVRRISSQGTQSPHSFVDVQGFPYWWGEDGIYKLDYNPQFDSFNIVNISVKKIQSFFKDIKAQSRSYVKGAFDMYNEVVRWVYTEDPTAVFDTKYRYDRELCYNTRGESFYTNEISLSVPRVHGVVYVRDSVGFTEGRIKYPTSLPVSSTTKYLTMSDRDKAVPTYIDWKRYAEVIGVATDAINYTSSFVTGYRLDGETQRYFQGNYLMVFLESEEGSGAFVQGVHDFTNSGDSGKWSSLQQVYNSSLTHRDINHRRLKMRGKGRSLQWRVLSEQGKPFNIIGWSILETSNANV